MCLQDGLAHTHMRGVICSGLFRQSSKQGCVIMCEMKIFGLKFVVCLGTLVQDGLAHMRGVTWRAVPAKFKTEILKYAPLWNLLGYLEKAFPSIYMPTRHQLKNFGRHSWVG